MKVYISGKIGEEVLSEATREKFDRAEAMLRGQGHRVFNPTRSGLGKVADKAVRKMARKGLEVSWYSEILLLDLTVLMGCDAIYMLPDWKDSPGARAELAYAEAVGKQVFEEQALVEAEGKVTI